VAIASRSKGEAVLAVDRYGIEPLAYATTASGALLFGSSCRDVARIGVDNPEICPQALFNYLFFYFVPAPGTIFRGVRKLLAGQMLQWRRGEPSLDYYWQPSFEERHSEPIGELGRKTMVLLEASVARQIREHDPRRVGAFLSGGLDSSTVTGLLSRQVGSAKAFTVRFDDSAHDESDYARAVARHFPVEHFEHRLTAFEAVEAIPEVVAYLPEPFGNTSVLPSLLCARMARECGVDLLLGGDGGDEIFGGNERYLDVLRTEQQPGVTRRIVRTLPTVLGGAFERALPGKLRRYWKRLVAPPPERVFLYNLFMQRSATEILDPDFLHRISVLEPVRIASAIFDRAANASHLKRLMDMDRQLTLADNDLRKVGTACAIADVAVRYPFLDDDLVEFAARIPSDLLIRSDVLRHFYKEATRGFLPDKVIKKRKHGFGMPYGRWLKEETAVMALIGDSVSSFRSRRIINDDFADQVTKAIRSETLSPLDGVAWDLMFLEQWLLHHSVTV
jgi:asparagine synthase (glutamine-hydrolysing)